MFHLIRHQHAGSRLEDAVDALGVRREVQRLAYVQRYLSDQPQIRDLPDSLRPEVRLDKDLEGVAAHQFHCQRGNADLKIAKQGQIAIEAAGDERARARVA